MLRLSALNVPVETPPTAIGPDAVVVEPTVDVDSNVAVGTFTKVTPAGSVKVRTPDVSPAVVAADDVIVTARPAGTTRLEAFVEPKIPCEA